MGVRVDCRPLRQFEREVRRLNDRRGEAFYAAAAREMAARLLALVIPRTPESTGKSEGQSAGEGEAAPSGGTLRRGWTGGQEDADAAAYAMGLAVERAGADLYRITVSNPVPYASYVEYGHRQNAGEFVPAIAKTLKESWVEGQFFLRASEDELKGASPAALEAMLTAYLRQVF